MYNYISLILRREESISVYQIQGMGFLPADFLPRAALWHHFFPSCPVWLKLFHFHPCRFCCDSHCCISPAKATPAEVPRHPGQQGSVFSLLLVLQALLRAQPGWALLGSKQPAGPKTGESSSCPGPHSFHTLFPLYIGILAISGLKFFKSSQGSWKHFGMLRRGCKDSGILRRAGNSFGCSERLQAFWDAQFQGILFWKRMCSGLAEAWVLLLGTNHFRQWSHWNFFVGSLKGVSRWAARRLI